MLVLSQKAGEAVLIGADITVRVLSIGKNGTVRVGYDAPKSMNVVRETLKEKLEAAGVEVVTEKDNVVRPRYREAR